MLFSMTDSDSSLTSSWSSASLSSGTEAPCGLRRLSRSPREILEKKARMQNKTGTGIIQMSDDVLEREIKFKLHYLELIERVGKDDCGLSATNERLSLQLKVRDLREQTIQARRLVEFGREEKKMLEEQVMLARRERDLHFHNMDERQKHNFQSLSVCRQKIGESEKCVINMLGKSPPGCLQFSNLLSLSGQLAEFSQGDHGSNFVVSRMKEGTRPERSLVMAELDLPQSLMRMIVNPNLRKVLIALMETDYVIKGELIREIRRNLNTILAKEWGPIFIKKVFPSRR